MPGATDPLYVAARRVLLDALDALTAHLDAIVLVGAQAVYIHAGEADLAIAPFTTDGDLAIDPRKLAAEPLLEDALTGARFTPAENAVGIWEMSVEIEGVPTPVLLICWCPKRWAVGVGGAPGFRHMQRIRQER